MAENTKRAAALFDLDGTLTNPFTGISNGIRHAMQKMGRAAPDDDAIRSHIGPPLQVTFAAFLETDDEARIWEAVGHYRERYQEVGKFENELIPGIKDALIHCVDAGYFLSVATSKMESYSRDIIVHFGLSEYFHAIHGSAPDGTNSNKAHLIRHILSNEPIDPSKAVMIGDRLHDIAGGKANGVPTIGVLWGFGDRTELEEAGAVSVVEKPSELASAIDRVLEVEPAA
ncbi:HAD hydrolase-like protein [Nitratireductor kimnyeongensis]|uniref:HAD hydrolase-like protein n=1 Tax=Nitratireductor kimnyeongensis TaxID=430679 RepID=A0ABW0T962_9HYPH|nr:HAD hydrolase-like protein [Nitratireductor kimnyeongensis]QZZ35732.1 HAD hydrolase-like protein [Nitratireductor kimnyeongensis]